MATKSLSGAWTGVAMQHIRKVDEAHPHVSLHLSLNPVFAQVGNTLIGSMPTKLKMRDETTGTVDVDSFFASTVDGTVTNAHVKINMYADETEPGSKPDIIFNGTLSKDGNSIQGEWILREAAEVPQARISSNFFQLTRSTGGNPDKDVTRETERPLTDTTPVNVPELVG